MNIINFVLHFIFAEHRRCAVPLLTGSARWVVCEHISQQAALWRISALWYLKYTPIELLSPESHMKTIRKTAPLKILWFYTTLRNKIASATPSIYKPKTQLNLGCCLHTSAWRASPLEAPLSIACLASPFHTFLYYHSHQRSRWGCSWGQLCQQFS